MVTAILSLDEATSQATMPVGSTLASAPERLIGTLAGPGAGSMRMEKFQTVLGRRNADVQVDDPDVSRQHAVVERYGERYLIRDLGSTNGTWLNGRRVEVEFLQSGDVIQVGDTPFTFQMELA